MLSNERAAKVLAVSTLKRSFGVETLVGLREKGRASARLPERPRQRRRENRTARDGSHEEQVQSPLPGGGHRRRRPRQPGPRRRLPDQRAERQRPGLWPRRA